MSDDPFAPSDRTILKPTPGGRSRGRVNREPSEPVNRPAVDVGSISTTGANPILKAATPLLAIGGQLRRSAQYDNTTDLFRQLAQGVRKFEADLKTAGETPEDSSLARYVLCGFLDEAILNTPWGVESDWSNRTLLGEFHKESSAGEKVFDLLERMLGNPNRYLDLLELIYVCISLGFRGKYRSDNSGEARLEDVRRSLYGTIFRERGSPEKELSPSWRGAEDVRPKITRFVPTWVVVAMSAAVLVTTFVGLYFSLESASDPVVGQIATLGRDLEPVVDRVPQFTPANPALTLVGLVTGRADGSIVEPGDHDNALVMRRLFASGSADLDAGYNSVLREIAAAINQLEGRVLITGHSDNVPIRARSIRFPSNWQLSAARANSVADALLSLGVDESRVSAEPRADTDPVCPTCNQNDAAEQALNRRVEIELLAGASRQ